MQQAFFARKNFNEGTYGTLCSAEDSCNLAFVDFSDFDILGEDFDFVLAGFGVCCICSVDGNQTFVVDVNLNIVLFNESVDRFTALANDDS